MKNVHIIAIIVVVLLLGGGLLYWYEAQAPTYSSLSSPQAPAPADTNTTPAPSEPSAPPAAQASAQVTIKSYMFSPATLTVRKGTTVTWTNNDGVPHTVTGDKGGPSSSALYQGNSYSYTFNDVGTFPYHCSVHPTMKGTVQVTM